LVLILCINVTKAPTHANNATGGKANTIALTVTLRGVHLGNSIGVLCKKLWKRLLRTKQHHVQTTSSITSSSSSSSSSSSNQGSFALRKQCASAAAAAREPFYDVRYPRTLRSGSNERQQ
jgi:hypothetical protein